MLSRADLMVVGATAFAALGGLHARPFTRPPSSVEPDPPQQAVRVTHTHWRVRACELAKVATGGACAARREDADSATHLVFRPDVAKLGTTAKSVPPVVVEFPHHFGTQVRTIRLRVGKWIADWPGYSALQQFAVAGDHATEVHLTTVTGRCELRRGVCQLRPSAKAQRIRIVDSD